MPTTVTLVPDHALVMAAAVGIWAVNQILGARVNVARSRLAIKVPSLYATHGMFLKDGKFDEEAWERRGVEFNKYQRGHQHMFENNTDAYGLLLLCGFFYPRYAAQWGGLWLLGTLMYGIGYSIKPTYRLPGEVLYFPAYFGWIYGIYCAGSAVWNSTPY